MRLFEVSPDDVADTSDDYYTPRWIFDAAGLIFDMDVAAPVNPARRACPARRYLTPIEDGLVTSWHGVVWMNPPYSNVSPWAARFAVHRCGLALLPTTRAMWVGAILQCADAITLLNVVKFNRPDGPQGTVPTMLLLAACGQASVEALARVAAADISLGGAYHVRPSGGVSCPRGTSGGRS